MGWWNNRRAEERIIYHFSFGHLGTAKYLFQSKLTIEVLRTSEGLFQQKCPNEK
jgi:hypothetical protein